MGQRGKAPEPTALKVLRGETRPSRLATAPAPQDPPDKPDDLKPNAGRVWDRVLAAIAVSSHIGPSHAESFRQYCEVTAAMNEMQPKGSKEWRELANIHRQLARELCLTPATSAGLIKKSQPARKLDKYLAG
jgi:phage terminase small subunit